MPSMRRTSPLTVFVFSVAGVAVGLIVQFALSARGEPPLVPPISLPLTLLVLAAVLLWLGLALRRALERKSDGGVNPFHAVRLLAGAKAGQFAGALMGGFGVGLLLQLFTRSVFPPATTWVPMLLTCVAGLLLVVCAIIAELMCRVPPSDPETDHERSDVAGPEPDGAHPFQGRTTSLEP